MTEILSGVPVSGNNCTGSGDCGAIDVSGAVKLAGTLDVLLANGFDPANGQSFIFLNFTPGELSGVFSNIADQYFNNDTQQWEVTYNNAAGFVELTAEAFSAPPPSTAPEPASVMLFGAGLAGLGLLAFRQSKRKTEDVRH